MGRLNENKLQSFIKDSGNSDVDVHVEIDIETKSIAYAILFGMFAKGELGEFELERAIRKLDELIERDRKRKSRKTGHPNENRPKIFQFPYLERRNG